MYSNAVSYQNASSSRRQIQSNAESDSDSIVCSSESEVGELVGASSSKARPASQTPTAPLLQTVKVRSHLFDDHPDVGCLFVERHLLSNDPLMTAKNLRWWSAFSKSHHAEAIGLLNQGRLATASLYATRYVVPRDIDFVLQLFNPGKGVVEKRLQALVDEYRSLYLNLGMRPNWYQIAGHFEAVGVVFNDRKLNALVVDISPPANSRGDGLASQAIRKIIDELSLAASTANSEQRPLPDIQLRYVGAKASDPGTWIVLDSLAENPGMLNALTSLHLGFTKFDQKFQGDSKASWLLPRMVSYLKRTTSLLALSFTDTTLSGQRCTRIAAALAVNSSVEYLHLDGCELTDGDASRLVQLLAINDTIRLLDLRGSAIGPAHPIWKDPRVIGGPVANSN